MRTGNWARGGAAAVLDIGGDPVRPANRASAGPRGLLQGPQRRSLHRLQRRRRLRPLRPRDRAPPRQAHPRQSDHRAEEHGRRRQPAARQLALQRRAEGRHRDRHHRPRHRFDPLLGSKGAQFEADKFTWIGSANNEVSICVAWNTSGITKFEDTADQGADRRRHRRGRRHRPVSAHPQRRARHQDSRSSPAIPAATTSTWRWSAARCKGRCGWSWSSVLVDAQALDRRQVDQHPGAARRSASIPTCPTCR